MIIIVSVLFLTYGLTVLWLSQGIRRLENIELKPRQGVQEFSVVVPFRNEQQHLTALLECFKRLDYPRHQFEVLLVDDDSEDESVAVIENFMRQNPELRISILKNSKGDDSPKKRAIEKAIDSAAFPWIVTTDADCSFSPQWLMSLDQLIENNDPVMLIGPVTYDKPRNFLERFQLLDFLSLQGTAMGGFGNLSQSSVIRPFLCNGANLAYKKIAFAQIRGFEGNRQVPSGDDVFLLEKMLDHFPGQVLYLKSYEALVTTLPQSSWKSFVQQRVRWASKTTAIGNNFGKMLGFLVLLVNFFLLVLPLFAYTGHISWAGLGLLFLIKFNVDFVLIYRSAEFFRQQQEMRTYFISSLVYPVYSVMVAIWSLFGKYSWKGRNY